jgi:outer membrane protein TolC
MAFDGCARGVYRRWADRDAYHLIDQKAERVNASADGWKIDAGPDSRWYDPTDKDHPPRPEDDPVAFTYMRTGRHRPVLSKVEEDNWRKALPGGGRGEVILQLKDAVEVALRNSQDFQTAREDLYLSALDLSEQRYLLHPHFNADTNGTRLVGPSTTGAIQTINKAGLVTNAGVSWMNEFGGQLLAGVANTIIWDFDRPNLRTATSLLNFSLVQPLMRFGGRARTLEPLTQAERHLLANVRRMEQYQQGFYLSIVAGRSISSRPARAVTATSSAPSLFAGTASGVAGLPGASGFLGLLQEQQSINNLESNVAGLRSSLAQLEAAFDAGRATSVLQVLQARQALQSAQSNLLTARAAYQTHIDNFKADLGLPPSLPVELRDKMLDRFTIFDPSVTALQNQVTDLATALQDREHLTTPAAVVEKLATLETLRPHFESAFAAARHDLDIFRESLPARLEQFGRLRNRPEVAEFHMTRERFEAAALQAKVEKTAKQLDTLEGNVRDAYAELAKLKTELPTLDLNDARARGSALAANLSGFVLRLSLERAGSRIESVTVPDANLTEKRALDVARANRLDWMNARTELVDAWRKIDYNANPLMSGLDLNLDADLGTTNPTGHNSVTHFDTRNGHATAGVTIDTPLDRLRERNTYRESLVDYQRARRSYIDFEDNVSQSLRNTLRLVSLGQLNFEIRRAAVQTALAQVDLARLKLDEPPRPGEVSTLGVTAARDLVSALSDLLDAQNAFLSLWVGDEVLRMELDYELGLMEIDGGGHWVEPGPFTNEVITKRLARRAANNRLAGAPSTGKPAKVVE